MSEISGCARTHVLMADFANVDAAGKLNVVGAGVSLLGLDPMQGVTAPFSLAISIQLPYEVLPADFAIEIALMEGDQVISLQGPAGELQAIRVAQNVNVERASQMPNPQIRDHVGGSASVVVNFFSGLPLSSGGIYVWRVSLDGDVERAIEYRFAVATTPDIPVLG